MPMQVLPQVSFFRCVHTCMRVVFDTGRLSFVSADHLPLVFFREFDRFVEGIEDRLISCSLIGR